MGISKELSHIFYMLLGDSIITREKLITKLNNSHQHWNSGSCYSLLQGPFRKGRKVTHMVFLSLTHYP